MANEFKLSPIEVKESLGKMKKKIDELNNLRNKLSIAMHKYKENFKDDISTVSTEIMKKIDAEIELLNKSFVNYTNSLQKLMDEIQNWRSFK